MNGFANKESWIKRAARRFMKRPLHPYERFALAPKVEGRIRITGATESADAEPSTALGDCPCTSPLLKAMATPAHLSSASLLILHFNDVYVVSAPYLCPSPRHPSPT